MRRGFMKKYEEPRYQWGEICEHIYPWVKKELTDTQALNGKHFSEKDAAGRGISGRSEDYICNKASGGHL